MAKRAATLVDVLDGHTVLDIECVDRIYLNAYIPSMQTSGGMVGFLRHRGFPIPSPAALGRIGDGFRRAMASYAEANHIPWIRFGKHDRKIEVMRPYLEVAERTGRSQVVAIGVASEVQWVYDATQKKEAANGIPWFDYYRAERKVTCYYVYVFDEQMGPGFIKICAYAPYPIKVWLNGHEAVKRMAAAAGLQVTPLSNGFAACSDPVALQGLCDRLQAGRLRVFFERWMHRLPLPLPLTPADRDRGYWWRLSMRQVEVSRTIVLDDPRRIRTVFEYLLADNMGLGRPEHIEIIFARKVSAATPGTFSTRLLNRADQVTVNLAFKHSRIKIYLKDDRALRVETVINDAGDLGCRRGLEHLDELTGKARACNARLMDAVRAGQGSAVLASPSRRKAMMRGGEPLAGVLAWTGSEGHRSLPGATGSSLPLFERIAQPTLTEDGRRAPALRFGDPRVQALAGSLNVLAFAVTGITNKSLRAWMTGLLGTPYSMNQAGYDLARLRRNELIRRVEHTNTYTLTADGQAFAIFYSKLHDRVLYPLMAAGQPLAVPIDVRRAVRTIERHIDHTVTAAGLTRAA